jgi:hypothetical protein
MLIMPYNRNVVFGVAAVVVIAVLMLLFWVPNG